MDRYDAENASARGKNKNKQISKDFKLEKKLQYISIYNK